MRRASDAAKLRYSASKGPAGTSATRCASCCPITPASSQARHWSSTAGRRSSGARARRTHSPTTPEAVAAGTPRDAHADALPDGSQNHHKPGDADEPGRCPDVNEACNVDRKVDEPCPEEKRRTC